MDKTYLRAFALATIVLSTATGCVAATTEEEEPVGESEDHLLAGRLVPETEIADAIREAGFAEDLVGKMVCTAKYESRFYERATNKNRNGTIDRGLFQINSIHVGGTAGCPSSGEALFDPAANTKCAFAVYESQGINAWYGYRKHRTECDAYQVGAAPAGPDGAGGGGGGDDKAAPEGGGGCYSGTLGETVGPLTCVQSKFDNVWFQCKDGTWYRGVEGSNGPHGACTATHPL